MAEITFVEVENTVEVKQECAEEDDPLSVSMTKKGKIICALNPELKSFLYKKKIGIINLY